MNTADILKNIVANGVREVARDPNTPLTQAEAAPVTKAIITEILPPVLHATNNEPWYQSRVTWGALGAIVLPILGVIGVTSDVIDMDTFVGLGIAAGTVFSGIVTLWGRWKARKPIGMA